MGLAQWLEAAKGAIVAWQWPLGMHGSNCLSDREPGSNCIETRP
jgi:hypothetical protein